jgi:hypothetical protein
MGQHNSATCNSPPALLRYLVLTRCVARNPPGGGGPRGEEAGDEASEEAAEEAPEGVGEMV